MIQITVSNAKSLKYGQATVSCLIERRRKIHA